MEYVLNHEGQHNITGYDVVRSIKKGLIPRRNFEDFPRAFLLSFQVMTGDDWINQMNDYMEVFSKWVCIPFFLWAAFSDYCLLSLFIAVILQNFEIAEEKKLELQKHRHKTQQESAEDEARRVKVSFVHRIVWLFGGQGSAKVRPLWHLMSLAPAEDLRVLWEPIHG